MQTSDEVIISVTTSVADFNLLMLFYKAQY